MIERFAITTGFLAVPGGRLYYETAGTGRAVTLLHSGVAHLRMWDEQVPVLAPRFRTIAYDARGHGQSRTEPVRYSDRQDLADLLAHLGVERTTLVGNSRGGALALDLALERPDLVDGLVLVAAGLSGYEHQPTEADRPLMPMWDEMEAAWEKRDFDCCAELEARVWGDGPGQPVGRMAAGPRERLRAMSRDNLDHSIDGWEPSPVPLEPPAAGRLAEIRVPTLIVVGDLDTPAILRIADILGKGIPGARQVVLPGVAHLVNLERPDEFNRLLLDFLGAK